MEEICGMSGNAVGGKKAAAINIANDPDFYRKIGRLGGRVKSPLKGFGGMPVEKRIAAGRKGGRAGKRATPSD